ncbi:hypothetical protein BurJ1DRAFT_5002 [Burkholderiales bacterium JOSHI_001]|nr:hypothetical protein BurJ1DRAFT_5002 [Burkholderiales bacterium JOSHI_001]
MSLKSLLEMLNTHRVLPEAAAAALPAATQATSTGPRVMRRALPSRGATQRQLELDFRPGSRGRGPAPASADAAQDDKG